MTGFRPIILTADGDRLREFKNFAIEEDSRLFVGGGRVVGKHDLCGGWFTVHQISMARQALVCDQCRLRLVLPASVKTYRDLREYCRAGPLGKLARRLFKR